jgi:cell division septum initiation protein DivIVA
VDFSSHQAAQIRFTSRGDGYDQLEVEEFRRRVRNVLAFYERNWEGLRAGASTTDREVVDLREQVAGLEGRLAEERNGAASPVDTGSSNPEFRGGGDKAAAHLAAAREEAAGVVAAAQMEAESLIAAAMAQAASLSHGPENEARTVTRRLATLRTAMSDVERRLRDLVGSTIDELSLVGDLIDLETSAVTEIAGLKTDTTRSKASIPGLKTESPWVKKTGSPWPGQTRPVPSPPPPPPQRGTFPATRTPAAAPGDPRTELGDDTGAAGEDLDEDIVSDAPGFYEKRLSGLRERISRIES